MPFRVPMTVRVIAIESCSATHFLSVSRKRGRRSIELLHEGLQWPLRVGLQSTQKQTELTMQVAQVRSGRKRPPRDKLLRSFPLSKAVISHDRLQCRRERSSNKVTALLD
jgi:hypothetical protein